MTEAKTVTTKVTPRTLMLARQISAKTGEKLYKIFERLAEREKREISSRNGQASLRGNRHADGEAR